MISSKSRYNRDVLSSPVRAYFVST